MHDLGEFKGDLEVFWSDCTVYTQVQSFCILMWKLTFMMYEETSCQLKGGSNMLFSGISYYFEANFELFLCYSLVCAFFSLLFHTVFPMWKSKHWASHRQRVLRINPAADISFPLITPETAGFEPITPAIRIKRSYHSALSIFATMRNVLTTVWSRFGSWSLKFKFCSDFEHKVWSRI